MDHPAMVTRVALALVTLILVSSAGGVASWLLWSSQGEEKRPSQSFVDDLGRSVSISGEPVRIVSLVPSNTEILFALGLGDRVVGVDSYSNYPPEVLKMIEAGKTIVVGGVVDPSVEKIMALKPDLVLAGHTNVQRKVVEQLEAKGLTVIAFEPKNISHVMRNIVSLGRITGVADKAEDLVKSSTQRIELVERKVKGLDKVKVYYEVWPDPMMSVGPGTWIHELLLMAGGSNIFDDAAVPYPLVSPESVISRNPDVIIVPRNNPGGEEGLKARPGWRVINAVKRNQVYGIDSDIVSRPSHRMVDGLEQIAKYLHPEVFAERQ